jgi:hypothetical protein
VIRTLDPIRDRGGFYEWAEEGSERLPQFFHRPDDDLVLMARFSVFQQAETGGYLHHRPSENEVLLSIMLLIIPTGMVIAVVQNLIRRFQGRQPRPLFDLAVLKFNLQLWLGHGR